MKALVLGGGGSKGAYEIGVWQALRKLGIKFDIVTGTSIGALNGALVVQNSFYIGKLLWENTNFYKLFGKDLRELNEINKALKIYGKNFVKMEGIDIKEYENFVKKWVNVNKIYKSNIDYGLVTCNLKTMKPLYLTKDKIAKDKFCDYVIASTACFPALDIKEIDNEKYIDGGYYDNLPINLAIDLGADEVIAVDLDAFGIKRNIKNKDVKITVIKPSCNLGNFMIFDKKTINKNIKIGYNDTMKVFGKLEGNHYTFKKNDLDKNYQKYGEEFAYYTKRMIGINNKKTLTELTSISFYKRLIKNNFDDEETMNKSIELLGEIFDVSNDKIYDINMFNHILRMKFYNYEEDELLNMNNIKKLNFKKSINHKQIIKTIYNFMLEPIEYHKELTNLSVLFPKEFMGAMYLYTIN